MLALLGTFAFWGERRARARSRDSRMAELVADLFVVGRAVPAASMPSGPAGIEHVEDQATGADAWIARGHRLCTLRDHLDAWLVVGERPAHMPATLGLKSHLWRCDASGAADSWAELRLPNTEAVRTARLDPTPTPPRLRTRELSCALAEPPLAQRTALLAGTVHVSGLTPAFFHEWDQAFDWLVVRNATARRAGGAAPEQALLLVNDAPAPSIAARGRACVGAHRGRGCLPARLAAALGEPFLTSRDLFAGLDALVAPGSAPIDAACFETAIFWEVRRTARRREGALLAREAMYRAFLHGHMASAMAASAAEVDGRSAAQLDVVLSTRPLGSGGAANDLEVLDALRTATAGAGFRRVRRLQLGEMELEAQVRAMASAAIVVGAHGAGLTHLNWQPAGACVIEVFPECVYDSCYRLWSSRRGDLHYFGLLNGSRMASPDPSAHAAVAPFRADVCAKLPTDTMQTISKRFARKCRFAKGCWGPFRKPPQRIRVRAVVEAVRECLRMRGAGSSGDARAAASSSSSTADASSQTMILASDFDDDVDGSRAIHVK